MDSADADEDAARPSGWYSDRRDPSKQRYWDGDRWSGLSRSAGPGARSGGPPATDPRSDDGSAAGRGPDDAATGIRRPVLIGVIAVLIALLVAAGVWMVAGGSDDPDDPAEQAGATTASDDEGASTSTTSAAPPTGPTDPSDGAPTTAPGPTPTEGAGPESPPTTQAIDPLEPCTADGAVLLRLLQAHPPLESLASELTVDDVRCVGRWATGVVSSPQTDSALAVFELENGSFKLLLLGSSEPCAGLGIAPESESELGCDFST